jgi:hypothetical protein
MRAHRNQRLRYLRLNLPSMTFPPPFWKPVLKLWYCDPPARGLSLLRAATLLLLSRKYGLNFFDPAA